MPSATYSNNGNPTSVSVQTGSYTIPANKYAYVTAFINGGSVSVDGTAIITNNAPEAVHAFDNSSGAISYTVPSGGYFQGQVYTTAQAITINSNTLMAASSAFVPLTLGAGATVGFAGNTGVRQISGCTIRDSGGVVASFWVPTGTAITTSSGRYLVQLY